MFFFCSDAESAGMEKKMRNIPLLLLAAIASCAAPAFASETITYTYDAKGRLVTVAHVGSVNNAVVTTYAHDKADNRITKTTTGSSNPPPP
jgi:hypothetical protein